MILKISTPRGFQDLFDAYDKAFGHTTTTTAKTTGYNYDFDEKGNKINVISGIGSVDYGNFQGYKSSDIEKAEIKEDILAITFKKGESSSKYVKDAILYFKLPKDTNKETVSIEIKDGILTIETEEIEKQVFAVKVK